MMFIVLQDRTPRKYYREHIELARSCLFFGGEIDGQLCFHTAGAMHNAR